MKDVMPQLKQQMFMSGTIYVELYVKATSIFMHVQLHFIKENSDMARRRLSEYTHNW